MGKIKNLSDGLKHGNFHCDQIAKQKAYQSIFFHVGDSSRKTQKNTKHGFELSPLPNGEEIQQQLVFPKIGVPENGWFIYNGKPY